MYSKHTQTINKGVHKKVAKCCRMALYAI